MVESGVQAVEIGAGSQTDGVAEEGEVQVSAEVEFQLSGIFSYYPCLSLCLEMEGLALGLVEQSAHADRVLAP